MVFFVGVIVVNLNDVDHATEAPRTLTQPHRHEATTERINYEQNEYKYNEKGRRRAAKRYPALNRKWNAKRANFIV